VATISRLLKIIGLFCKRALENRLYSAKETYDFEEPTNRSHPIGVCFVMNSPLVLFRGFFWMYIGFFWHICGVSAHQKRDLCT